MARIAGVNLPNKRIEIALTYVFGVGLSRAQFILKKAGVDPEKRANELTESEENKVRTEVQKFPVEGDLRQKISLDIKRLEETGSYKGYRHRRRLPVRGQRTKTNARTRKGKARVQITNKKKV